MLRIEGALNHIYSRSECLFYLPLETNAEALSIQSDWKLFFQNGGTHETSLIDGHIESAFRVSHGVMDAFGAFFLIGKIYSDPLLKHSSIRPDQIHTRIAEPNHLEFKHFWTNISETTAGTRTLPQIVLKSLTNFCEKYDLNKFAVASAVEDTRNLSSKNFMGNSVVMVGANRDRCAQWSNSPSTQWHKEIKNLSERILKVNLKRKFDVATANSVITVSCIGDVTKIPYISSMHPSTTMGASTPSGEKAVNIFFWCNKNDYALSVAGCPSHPIIVDFQEFIGYWKKELLGDI